jgi:hypothetical protein
VLNSSYGDSSSNPPVHVFQEKITGNFSTTNFEITQILWSASPGAYFEGTFEIFNSSLSYGTVCSCITTNDCVEFNAPIGFSVGRTATKPTEFSITVPAASSGTYSITLYKRVLG